ncbi:MAG: DNA polymerase III subunit delta [Patescibacteria group bacterium]
MIIFLHGQDSYSLIQYVNNLIARYEKKYPGSFNFHRFDLEEDDPAEIKNVIKSTSFFKQVKFAVVKNPFAKSEVMEKLIKENSLEKDKDSVLLLYQTGEEEKFKNLKLFDLLNKTAQIKEFKPPERPKAAKFASDYLSKNQISIERTALNKLVKEGGSDFWRLKNELDKLINFSKQNKAINLKEEDLSKLVSFKLDQNIFNILDSLFSNQSKALLLLEDYFSSGGDPLYLISMIAFQLKNMLIVRELIDKKMQYAQILKKTGMHPFFFKKIYEASKKYSLSDLKNIFRKAVDFEMALKTGQAEAETAFFKIFL